MYPLARGDHRDGAALPVARRTITLPLSSRMCWRDALVISEEVLRGMVG